MSADIEITPEVLECLGWKIKTRKIAGLEEFSCHTYNVYYDELKQIHTQMQKVTYLVGRTKKSALVHLKKGEDRIIMRKSPLMRQDLCRMLDTIGLDKIKNTFTPQPNNHTT